MEVQPLWKTVEILLKKLSVYPPNNPRLSPAIERVAQDLYVNIHANII